MISHLSGKILYKNSSYLILEVGSVGYKVFTTPEILKNPVGNELAIFTYQKVSENDISLFGLPDAENLDFFEKLLSVSGIGPRTALNIISAGNITSLQKAIEQGDSGFFGDVAGVGKKTSERIVVELKNKLTDLKQASESPLAQTLKQLGYKNADMKKVLPNIDHTLSLEEQIKQALKIIRG